MALQKLPCDSNTERSLLLALYTEVTMANALKNPDQAVSTDVSIITQLLWVVYDYPSAMCICVGSQVNTCLCVRLGCVRACAAVLIKRKTLKIRLSSYK